MQNQQNLGTPFKHEIKKGVLQNLESIDTEKCVCAVKLGQEMGVMWVRKKREMEKCSEEMIFSDIRSLPISIQLIVHCKPKKKKT